MRLANVLALYFSTPGTQTTSPGPRSADTWVKTYLENKERKLNDMRISLSRIRDPQPKPYEMEGAEAIYLPHEQRIELTPEGGRWALVDQEGLLLGTFQDRSGAERAQAAKTGSCRIIDLGMDFDTTRPRPLNRKVPRPVTQSELLRWNVFPRRHSGGGAAGAGGAAGPGGGSGAGG